MTAWWKSDGAGVWNLEEEDHGCDDMLEILDYLRGEQMRAMSGIILRKLLFLHGRRWMTMASLLALKSTEPLVFDGGVVDILPVSHWLGVGHWRQAASF